jgi:hypothetical protein
MQYKGKLYGNIGGKLYFDTGKTSEDWDNLEKEVESFRSRVIEELEGVKKDMEAKIRAVDTSPNFNDDEKHMIKFGITMGIDSAKAAIDRIKNLK